MKTLDIIKSANSNLARSKMRTFLTLMAIFIGSFTISLSLGLGSGISQYVDSQLSAIGSEDGLIITAALPESESFGEDGPQIYNPEVVTASGSGDFGPQIPVLTAEDIAIIAGNEGIVEVEPSLSASPEYITTGNQKFTISMSVAPEGFQSLLSGSTVDSEASDNQAVIPIDFVEALGFSDSEDAVGESATIGIKSATGEISELNFVITGVQEKSLFSAGLAVNDEFIKTARDVQLQGLPEVAKNQYFAAFATVSSDLSDEDIKQLKDRLDEAGYSAMTIEDTIGQIHTVIDAITYVLIFFASIVLLAASFGIVNTLFMSVQERTKEIGLMKAMGMSSKKVFMLFSTEAALLGFWGSLIGVVIANFVGAVVNTVAGNTFLQDLEGFDLMAFPLQTMLIVMLGIMFVAFLAGTLPARRAAKLNPIDALRYE